MTMDVTETTFEQDVIETLARDARDRRLLGRVVRAVPCARAGARGGGRDARGEVVLAKVDVDANPGLSTTIASAASPPSRHSATAASWPSSSARDRQRRLRVSRRAPRATARSTLVEELRASGELPGVLSALEDGNTELALDRLLDEIPDSSPERREHLREVAVAVFHDLGHDDPVTVAYRRRLATALY